MEMFLLLALQLFIRELTKLARFSFFLSLSLNNSFLMYVI